MHISRPKVCRCVAGHPPLVQTWCRSTTVSEARDDDKDEEVEKTECVQFTISTPPFPRAHVLFSLLVHLHDTARTRTRARRSVTPMLVSFSLLVTTGSPPWWWGSSQFKCSLQTLPISIVRFALRCVLLFAWRVNKGKFFSRHEYPNRSRRLGDLSAARRPLLLRIRAYLLRFTFGPQLWTCYRWKP